MLVGAPVEEVEERDSGEESGKRNFRPGFTGGVNALGVDIFEGVPSAGDSRVTAEVAKGKPGNHESSDQESNSVDGVENSKCSKAAETCVNHSRDANADASDLEKGVVVFNPGNGLEVHDVDEALGSAVENDGNQKEGIGGQEN